MALSELLTIIAAITLGVATIICGDDIRRAPRYKKMIRSFDTLLLLYVTVIYVLIFFKSYPWTEEPLRVGMIVVGFLMVMEILIDRKGGN